MIERYSAEWWREYRSKNKEKLRAYKRQYDSKQYKENKERETSRRLRWAEKNPHKVKAHQAVYRATISGKLVKQPCHCGETRVVAHHPDYSKPLDVVWLCEVHHKATEHFTT